VIQRELEEKIDSLARLQRLNEHIVGSIRSGLVTADLDGKIAVFNKAAEEITGIENRTVLGSPVQRLIGEELWEMILGTGWLRDVRPLRHEAWFSFPRGTRRYLGFSISPLLVPPRSEGPSEEGALAGYIVAFQDLTEIKRLEEEIRLKERMAAIGRMAAGIAHEIRNPLTSMRGSVEVLRSHLELRPADARLMDILVRESERLNTFVEDFLTFARPRRYVRQAVEVTALLRDTCTLLCNNAEVKAKHAIELDLESPVMVHGSPDQLRQVFWNLAQNALRAMPAGGRLRIEARSAARGGGVIVFEDTGVGMTPEEQRQIFHPFQGRFKEGTGLGLSIVFQIIEDHKGKIHFESEKGSGTRVTLSIPAEAPVPAAVEA
jgi:two-component system sensor histidine kinase PilS (NtrC family)